MVDIDQLGQVQAGQAAAAARHNRDPWYGEDALDLGAVSRLLDRHEPEEGANGCQTQVERPDAGAPLRLNISKGRVSAARLLLGFMAWPPSAGRDDGRPLPAGMTEVHRSASSC